MTQQNAIVLGVGPWVGLMTQIQTQAKFLYNATSYV